MKKMIHKTKEVIHTTIQTGTVLLGGLLIFTLILFLASLENKDAGRRD